ncbi:MAG: hypothetical protein ABJG14_16225 [Sulfitobacter sp.]|uniref:hypothetical protein n=1 Tax=Alphaproteobacteria TaxID=28211 RepID=UPI0032671116
MKVFHTVAALALVSGPLLADGDLSTLSHSELVNNCVQVLDEGQDASGHAAELLARDGFHLGEENRAKGKRCLEESYGTEFVFKGGRYVSPEREANAAKALEEARKAMRRREIAYIGAVAEACIEEYTTDRFRALTTPACREVFIAGGLP